MDELKYEDVAEFGLNPHPGEEGPISTSRKAIANSVAEGWLEMMKMEKAEMKIFAGEIEMAAGDEEILAITILSEMDTFYGEQYQMGNDLVGRILTWDEARPALNYTHDSGYGGKKCHSIYAWTENWVLFVHEYDGSTMVESVPRNPKT